MEGQEVLMNLLPDVGNWQLEGIAFDGETACLTVKLRAKRQGCACRKCQQVSQHVHSWYTRTVLDCNAVAYRSSSALSGRLDPLPAYLGRYAAGLLSAGGIALISATD